MLAIVGVCHSKSSLCCEQATGLKEHLNREKATNQELVLQCSSAEQNVKAMEDEVRLVKRQLAIMAKARDVANQEKEDWKSTCNRCDSNFTHASSEWYAWHNLMLDPESGKSAGSWSRFECMLTYMSRDACLELVLSRQEPTST